MKLGFFLSQCFGTIVPLHMKFYEQQYNKDGFACQRAAFFDSFCVNQVLKLNRNALICSWFKMELLCVLKNLCLPVVNLMLKRFCGVDCFQISGKVAMLKKTFNLNDAHGKCGGKIQKATRETTRFLCLAQYISYSYSLSLCDP